MSQRHRESRWLSVLVAAGIFASASVVDAGPREQAKRIHDRLAGVPPTEAVLTQMASDISGGDPQAAAEKAMKNPAFYNVTLKNFATPWTNRDQTVHFPLNDYTATVIGLIRDRADFRTALYDDVIYVVDASAGVTAYSNSNNLNYSQAEALGVDLSDPAVLVQRTQSSLNSGELSPDTAAGVLTTRGAAAAFFYAGTNRAMFRFTMMNHLCDDLEQVKDGTRPPDHVRQDVARSPGGDSRVFLNNCVTCHAGMDGMNGAFAYYDYETLGSNPDDGLDRLNSGRLLYNNVGETDPYTGIRVEKKFRHNETTFPQGFVTLDDGWVNYWRNGTNSLLGWNSDYPGVVTDDKGNAVGNGAKSLGMELAHSDAFAECQVEKVFKAVCLRAPQDSADRSAIADMVTNFTTTHGYNMKGVFADAAVYCMGD